MNDLNNEILEDLHFQIASQNIELHKLRKDHSISNITFLVILSFMTGCLHYVCSINNTVIKVLDRMVGVGILEVKSTEVKPPHKKVAVD